MEDLVYFNRRAQQEREAAGRSRNATVRNRHLEFAEAYEGKVCELSRQPSKPRLHAVDAALGQSRQRLESLDHQG